MPEEALVVVSTFATPADARRIGRLLVEEKLVACANVLPGVESIYRWKDAIETATETVVLFKTTASQYYQLEARLKELHSYEVPEILALAVQAGSWPYLRWIQDSCQ